MYLLVWFRGLDYTRVVASQCTGYATANYCSADVRN